MKTLGMVLAGGRVGELSVLTIQRPKAAVVFGGMYRIIDFALTNLACSGIENVGILTQYRPSSLMDHIASGAPWGLSGRGRSVKILTPFQGEQDLDWYKGTADALYQNIDYIETHKPEHVLVASGDHIYRMDYGPFLDFHEKTGAGVTVAFTEVGLNHASRFGIGTLDSKGKILSYSEKPLAPQTRLASMTVYAFRKETLIKELNENARTGKSFQIYDEILPKLVAESKACGYVHEGSWRYARTLDEYYEANMELVGFPPKLDLEPWQIRTNLETDRIGDIPPSMFHTRASIKNSIVSPGCIIEGIVEGSILSPEVIVREGAKVKDSILMHGCEVGAGATVNKAIADKNTRIGAGAFVGQGEFKSHEDIHAPLTCGAVVIGKGAYLPEGTKVGLNVVIYPGTSNKDFPNIVPSGSTVRHR